MSVHCMLCRYCMVLKGLGDTGVYNTLLRNGLDAPATPQLDRMAAEGTTFADFHTLGAECRCGRVGHCMIESLHPPCNMQQPTGPPNTLPH
jgi:hypothetical protein